MEKLMEVAAEHNVFLGPGTQQVGDKTIGCLGVDINRTFDKNCYLTAHNAYAAKAYGWVYFQQTHKIYDQLRMGVRAVQLDIYPHEGDICLMHGGEGISSFIKPLSDCNKLSEIFAEIKQFLDENPSEVVTCIFETYVTDPAMMAKAIADGAVTDLIFWCNGTNGGPTCPPWPTLKEMIDSNKRLVLWSYKWEGDGLPCQWGYAVENVYGDACCEKETWARSRSDNYPMTHENPMCIMNHFPDKSFTLVEGILNLGARRNSSSKLLEHVEDIKVARGGNRLPSFISVDMHEVGDGGGPALAVTKVNEMFASV
eukprot:TRINITY_DN1068_c0_g2_i3.p1 TRINITY_DN1068_c0_g2~~TRINITY_DN1068_c0_g2_i3.p1  ORF type:complete len:312 (-),score=45.59 TRINITY_DN1068_c0_g2_i3:501-1436(-)